jgi:hypothetical protein
MDSEQKKLQINKNESGEESWEDKLAKKILAYNCIPTRERVILKFLMDWLRVTIINERGKRNVSELVEAVETLDHHYRAMKLMMLKAEKYDECMVEEKYGMNRRKINDPSEDSDDNNDDDEDDDDGVDDGGFDMEVDMMSDDARESEGEKA